MAGWQFREEPVRGNVSQAARLAKGNRTDFYQLLGPTTWRRMTSRRGREHCWGA